MTAHPPDQRAIRVEPAAPERWPDIEELFARIPCWCQYWRLSASEYRRLSPDQLPG